MTFRYEDKLTVFFSEKILSFFENMRESYDFHLESGGILIGVLNSEKMVTVTDVSCPYPQDVRGKYRFKRVDPNHQSFMDSVWESSGFQKMYFGEWHTHCEDIPNPSRIDISGWKSKSKGKRNAPLLFFLILGKKSLRLWTVDGNEIKELIPDAE